MQSRDRGYWHKISGVFSSAAFCVYSWSVLVFFWEIPSFLLRLNTGEIFGFAAYQLMFALIETSVVTLLIAALSWILPARMLRDNLHVSGTALVLALAVTSLIFKARIDLIGWTAKTFGMELTAANQFVMSTWLVLVIALPVAFLIAARRTSIARRIAAFVNSLPVLAGLYVVLSAAGILVVLIRNLL